MSIQDEEKLDNPVWYSLSETHRTLAMGYPAIKFYHPDYCPFGGFQEMQDISVYIGNYSLLTDNFFIVGEKPVIPDILRIKNELVCRQMITYKSIKTAGGENIVQLGNEHRNALSQLVNRVQPGFFKSKTALLGSYYGIFKNNQLVAVTGERMKMNNYIEVSAVITDPDHTGKGYARQLVAHTVNTIIAQNKIPYLHVAETNAGAIQLYETSGFTTRRTISFWNIVK